MAVLFKLENHQYESIDSSEEITWTGVTSFVGEFKKKFDPVAQSIKSSNNPNSKWYGMKPEEIQAAWNSNTDNRLEIGKKYHNERELDITGIDTITRAGRAIPIIKPNIIDGIKYAPIQRLTEGIYPEHLVYLKSAGLCGQSDRVEVIKDVIDVIDYKTNKEIKKEGFRNWEGVTQKMLDPVSHLDDCNFNHYSLQLSFYLYMILKHNPVYKAGKLSLQHVIFETQGEDKYGNPILKKDNEGNSIVKTVVPYDIPYLRTEVRNLINWKLSQQAL